MRLIDADKINYREHTECMGHGDFETVRTVTDKEIAEIPTVDAVEVVRCRDCKGNPLDAHAENAEGGITMDVREKLVELLREVQYQGNAVHGYKDKYIQNGELADHLISHGVTVQELDGCEYCNGLPFSQMEDFTMPNASKKDYDIVTIRFCPMCGRRLPQPPKGE